MIHPNIVPLLGVTIEHFQLISNWMSGGHLLDHIKENPDADRLRLVGIFLVILTPHSLLLLAMRFSQWPLLSPLLQHRSWGPQGCMWLSQASICYRTDTHQLNILVDGTGHAQITDFGLATVTQNLDSTWSTQPQHGYTTQWAAPEILNNEPHRKKADIFAFAMVMVKVCHR